MQEQEAPLEQPIEPTRRGHARRPPLAEIDTWELWQMWRRGDRAQARPWLGLMLGFCIVLGAMYSFFFYSTSVTDDRVAQIGLLAVLAVFLVVIWRRISPRRDFALYVVLAIVAVSGAAFGLWYLVYTLTGWYSWVATLGTPLLGLIGLLIGVRSLNAIARQQDAKELGLGIRD